MPPVLPLVLFTVLHYAAILILRQEHRLPQWYALPVLRVLRHCDLLEDLGFLGENVRGWGWQAAPTGGGA